MQWSFQSPWANHQSLLQESRCRPSTGWVWSWRIREGKSNSAALNDLHLSQYRRTPKQARVETALLVAGAPMTLRKLVQVATLADTAEAQTLLRELNIAYDAVGSPFRVEKMATGYQLLTRSEYARWLGRLHQRQAELKLTPAALETLTILAYKQPMTRADLEALRGVQCTDILKMLMERGLVRIAGEDTSLGRPFLYETTRKFLETYGLRSLAELPFAEELQSRSASDGENEGKQGSQAA